MKINHSKLKNTGIIFELLTRQIASDIVSGKESAAVDIVKNYFSKTELGKEHKLYQALVSSRSLSEHKAEILINATLEVSSRLNRTALRREKYNLIKEMRKYYDVEDFFKSKINNYAQYAAAYNLIESHNSLEFIEPTQVVENKITLLEFITKKEVNKDELTDKVLEEYMQMDKGTRMMTYRILLEKFNEKYTDLNNRQKLVLKEYINNISNTVKLRDFVNENTITIKNELKVLIPEISDPTTKIKVKEIVNFLKPLDKTKNVKDDDIVLLLQYYQLVSELKSTKANV